MKIKTQILIEQAEQAGLLAEQCPDDINRNVTAGEAYKRAASNAADEGMQADANLYTTNYNICRGRIQRRITSLYSTASKRFRRGGL
jgi:ribosomal protein S3